MKYSELKRGMYFNFSGKNSPQPKEDLFYKTNNGFIRIPNKFSDYFGPWLDKKDIYHDSIVKVIPREKVMMPAYRLRKDAKYEN